MASNAQLNIRKMAVLSKFEWSPVLAYDETDTNLSTAGKIYTSFHGLYTTNLRGDMPFFTDPTKLIESVSHALIDMRCLSSPKRVYARTMIGLSTLNEQLAQLVPLILSNYGEAIQFTEHIFINCETYKVSPYAYIEENNYLIDMLVDRLNDIQKRKAKRPHNKASTMDKILIYGKEKDIDENTPKDWLSQAALDSVYYTRSSFIFINLSNAQYLFTSADYFVQQLRDCNEITTTMGVTYKLPLDTAILVISSFL